MQPGIGKKRQQSPLGGKGILIHVFLSEGLRIEIPLAEDGLCVRPYRPSSLAVAAVAGGRRPHCPKVRRIQSHCSTFPLIQRRNDRWEDNTRRGG